MEGDTAIEAQAFMKSTAVNGWTPAPALARVGEAQAFIDSTAVNGWTPPPRWRG